MNMESYLSLKDGEPGTSKSDGVNSLWVWEPKSHDSLWGRIRPAQMHHKYLYVTDCDYKSYGKDRINEKCQVIFHAVTENTLANSFLWRRFNNQILSRRMDLRKSPFVLGVDSDGGLIAIRAAKRPEYNSDWSISKVVPVDTVVPGEFIIS